MDMSVNPDGMNQTDYSDFEYQQVDFRVSNDEAGDSTGAGNIIVAALGEIEPLADIGGLDNNEVAELVYLETFVTLTYADQAADQDVATTGLVQGAVGANLSPAQASLPRQRTSAGTVDIFDARDIDESNISTQINGGSDDRWFQLFKCEASAPFDDQTNGPGGAGSNADFHAVKNYRTLTGRGPVLDSSDDITIPVRGSVGDTVINATFNVRVHMVWDVAETSDAGRAFSVPK